ncbi:MAG TPA: pilus assembly protein TadG-related protein [Lacipirellulaceae bacterium]|jgi:Flp pilus assembly protein TadG
MRRKPANQRRGIILPVVAVAIVGLIGLVALAVDIGRLVVAQSECQAAADSAAIAGARSLDGTQNLTGATANAVTAASNCKVLGETIPASEVTVSHGSYHYDASAEKFSPQIPAVAPDNFNLTQVVVTHTVNLTFARVFGRSMSTVTATSIAAHRPRDIAIVLDYSGSMNNESDLWNNESYLGSVNNSSNNTDPVFPKWGPYNPTFSPNATLQCTSSDTRVGMCNVTQSVSGIPPLANDFFQNNFGGSGVGAFGAAGSSTSAPISGDNYQTSGGNCILSWSDTAAAKKYTTFYGYTQGPKYWGKTFFIWPPEPSNVTPTAGNTTAFPAWGSGTTGWDWRKLYFLNSSGSAPVNSNLSLWNSSGVWNDPSGSYRINYKAILAWIKSGPNPFPAQLRAGKVLYYSAIPTDVPASAYDHTQSNTAIGNADQRFWKEYIDYVVGVWRDPVGNIQHPGNPSCSYGPDFTAGSGRTPTITGPDGGSSPFVGTNDNPKRPRHRLWFGPMTMIQYMLDTGLLPGTTHDVSMVAAKLGVHGALQDVKINHPNDLVSLIMFSRPHYSGEPTEVGQFSIPQVSLTNDVDKLTNALWYPPNTSTSDVRPWDANGMQTPRAHGDYNANTATDYGFMLAYNQLSSNPALVSSGVGGLGRKGAHKIVILETDGMANQASSAAFTNGGAYQSYYNVGPFGSATTSGASPATSCINVAQNICALDTASPPGYAQPQRPVEIDCIAFGAIFEPTASGSEQANATSFLQSLSSLGGTTFPSSPSDPDNGYKICIGSLSDRQAKLQTAFTKILDETESIILVK